MICWLAVKGYVVVTANTGCRCGRVVHPHRRPVCGDVARCTDVCGRRVIRGLAIEGYVVVAAYAGGCRRLVIHPHRCPTC